MRLFLTTYGLIFLAELPDKTALSTVMLAARRRHLAVFCGAAGALLIQTGIAVAFGRAIALLPRDFVRYGAAALFLFVAVKMWREAGEQEEEAKDERAAGGWWADARTAFLVIFLAEWGDLTQLSTAALVAKHRAPVPVFFGAVLGLWSVSALAALLGSRLKRWLNPKLLHRAGAVVFALVGLSLLVSEAAAAEPAPSWYSLRMQATVIDQGHSRFRAPYTGLNSQRPDPESAASVTSTLFFAARPWKDALFVLDPELGGGRGMSSTLGIAGFPNGEIYRAGDPRPSLYTARLYLRQVFGLGGGSEKVDAGQNAVAETLDERRVTVVAGKFGLSDFFDDNSYAHDARTQFFNWALMAAMSFDFPADTRGYTWGAVVEYKDPAWALRGAAVAEPTDANGPKLDRRVGRAQGLALEADRVFEAAGRRGVARLIGFFNEARMGSYDEAIARAAAANAAPDVTQTRAYGRTKFGAATNAELALSRSLGAFFRGGWSDGRNESWAFAEVDHSFSGGVEYKPAAFGRPDDRAGLGQAYNGLSTPHRRYLADGGSGFMLGDGALRYGPEIITELYYKVQATPSIAVTPDAQLIVNPGYNRDRGPIPVWGVRVHADF